MRRDPIIQTFASSGSNIFHLVWPSNSIPFHASLYPPKVVCVRDCHGIRMGIYRHGMSINGNPTPRQFQVLCLVHGILLGCANMSVYPWIFFFQDNLYLRLNADFSNTRDQRVSLYDPRPDDPVLRARAELDQDLCATIRTHIRMS